MFDLLWFIHAVKGIRDKVQIATKFALTLEAQGKLATRGDQEHVPAACEASLKRLDVDCIDLYYQHRLDTSVPIESRYKSDPAHLKVSNRFACCCQMKSFNLSSNFVELRVQNHCNLTILSLIFSICLFGSAIKCS